MHTFIIDMLLCPECHGNLDWDIFQQANDRIETGQAQCVGCGAAYAVRESIGVFLTPEQQDVKIWEQESQQVRYVREHPMVKRELLESSLETLHPADQHYRAVVLESRGQFAQAKVAAEQAQQSLYGTSLRQAQKNQFDYVIKQLISSEGPIFDLASGRCYLVEDLLGALKNPIVVTDWSLPILRRNRRYFEFWGQYERISLLAFDARKTPFKDGSVQTMTTFVGLPSVGDPANLLRELRRVVSGTLVAISVFYPQEDQIHAPVIHRAGMEAVLYRARVLDAFRFAGWHAEIANVQSVTAHPLPRGKLLPQFQIDGFPLAEIEQELCTLIAH